MDDLTRNEIVTLARVLRAAMRSDLEQLTRDRATLNDFERFSSEWRNHLVAVNAGESLRDEYSEMLRKLLELVYRHLPAEGRELREITRLDEPESWDWDAANAELQGIEVAVNAVEGHHVNTQPVAEADLPTLRKTDVKILRWLAERQGVSADQYDMEGIASRRTLGPRLQYLREAKYVTADNRITQVGLERLALLPKDCA